MGVSSHPAEGVVVISLWQGDVCTATFRMPLDDSAQLISVLAYGMVRSGDADKQSVVPAASWMSRVWRRLVGQPSTESPAPAPAGLRVVD